LSSTNRSEARDTHISDYYKTPVDSIIDFIDDFVTQEKFVFDGKILDPCAGGMVNKDLMSYPEALRRCGWTNIDTIDIREDSLAKIKGDYLHMDCKNKYDMIITNPPFNIALDVIKKALDDVKSEGWVIMLLRLNFFEGKARKEFWESNMPIYSFVHHKRMSFTDDGKTDSIAYQHCCWKKGNNPEFVKLKII
jgi:hypothetical protein